jgi:hypothetical protein
VQTGGDQVVGVELVQGRARWTHRHAAAPTPQYHAARGVRVVEEPAGVAFDERDPAGHGDGVLAGADSVLQVGGLGEPDQPARLREVGGG